METSAILTIGLLGIWCSLCVDDKDKSDQRMLGYALGFGLLFILVCKNLYSEDEECSTYEYATNDNGETSQPQVSDERSSFGPVMLPIMILVFVALIIVVFFIPRRIRDTNQSEPLSQSDTGQQQSVVPQQLSDTEKIARAAYAERVTS